MSFSLYDSIQVDQIPSGATAVAGYVGGSWPDYSELAQRFPKAHHLSVAVNAGEDADCLDIENGDAVPGDAPAWHSRQIARGVIRPCFYANTSTMPLVIEALTAAKVNRNAFRVWTAHYTYVEHIEPGSDATQWTNHALGRDLDQSLAADDFFAAPAPVRPVKNKISYDWFYADTFIIDGVKLIERSVVERYDQYRVHPLLDRKKLAPVRFNLARLAGRIYEVAHSQPRDDGRPSWNVDHRGWRYQQLSHRAQGQRFV